MTAASPIRPARPADLAEISRLEAESFAPAWSPRQVEDELNNRAARLWVAEDELRRVVGYAAFRLGPGEVELLRLAVDVAARRRGLGRALVHWGLVAAGKEGADSCFLEVRSGNGGAIAFYERLGFTRLGKRPAYYDDGEDALVLGRALPRP